MLNQGIQSLLVSVVIAVICFVPYFIFQYRRYGQFSASRAIWMAVLLVYSVALLAYTLFPLPSAAWCSNAHPGLLELDPTKYFRDMWQMHAGGRSWASVATSWTSLQMVLNVVLFLPLGVILRHLWKVGVWRATLIGFGLSLLIELTQLTGNWFTAPCPYRVADISDLWTNTLGAFLGAAIALLVPRLAADPAALVTTRGVPKPVTRGRRLVGMLCDALVFGLVTATIEVVLVVAYVAFRGMPSGGNGSVIYGVVIRAFSEACGLAVGVVAALLGSGASIGQRLVYLTPVAHSRTALVWRVLISQGVVVALVFWVPGGATFGWLWLLIMLVWVLFRVKGASFTVANCSLADARISL